MKTQLAASEHRFTVFCRNGLGFDSIYNFLFVKPYQVIAMLNRRDIIDQTIMSTAWYVGLWHDVMTVIQNGNLRWYLAAFGLSIAALVGVSIL
jgi:NADH-quinone oxidoreductase subunit L